MCMRWMCASWETLSRGREQYRSAVWWTITFCAGLSIAVLSRGSTAFQARRHTTAAAKQQCGQIKMLEITYKWHARDRLWMIALTRVHVHGFSRCVSVHISDKLFFQQPANVGYMNCKLTNLLALTDREVQTCCWYFRVLSCLVQNILVASPATTWRN